MNDVPPPMPGSESPVPPIRFAPPPPPPPFPPCPPKRSLFGRLLSLVGFLAFLGSMFLNVTLLIALGVREMSLPGMRTEVLQAGDGDQTVAVYRVEGVIDSEAADQFRKFYNQVKDEPKVRAVVLYVNSPGGTVSDSEQIYRMIADLKARGKTVVASMGGLAASGGYYISACADEIFAEPATITGSIGVITGVLNLQGTLDKVGMEVIVLKSTHAEGWKDMLSSFRQPQEREKQYVISLLNDMQDRFESIVKQGRGDKLQIKEETYQVEGAGPDGKTITKTDLAPLNGKIYIAAKAKEYGLIDTIGFLDDAYNKAAQLANLTNPNVVEYRKHASFLESLGGAIGPSLHLDAKSIQNAQTPQFMMLWKPDW